MPFIVEKVEDEQYVSLEFTDILTLSILEQSRSALKVILYSCNAYRKVLVNMQKIVVAVRDYDIRQFVSSHKDELPAGCLIAVIVHPRDWETAIFAETVAHNRGIYMRVFRNELHARAWLGISD
jgi:hypothetical protein